VCFHLIIVLIKEPLLPVSEVNQQHETIAVEQIQLGSFRHHHLSEDCRLKKKTPKQAFHNSYLNDAKGIFRLSQRHEHVLKLAHVPC